MTIRRLVASLATLGLIGCAATDAPPSLPKRTTLVPAPGVFGFQFSKQGRLAYAKFIDAKAAIFVSDADGRNAKRVSFGVWDYGPVWSPDGKWIAFTRDAGAHNDVIIVSSDGGAEIGVGVTLADEVPNGWLADGSGFLFTRTTGRGAETWVYNLADRSSAKAIEADGSVRAYASPDGKWLAYTVTKDGKSTIWLRDREKKTSRQLTTEGFEQLWRGSFSPDGKSLLYRSERSGTGDLWRLDVATGERRQLTQDIAEDGNGEWSRDGTRIVFLSNRGGQPDLWIMSSGESDVQRVTDDALEEADAEWTPDGRSIVASVALGYRHLYRIPVAGDGPPVALTSGDFSVGEEPQVSADGLRIVYNGTKNGDDDIWVVPVAGGEPKLVSGAPGYDGQPDWSPDMKRIAFNSWRGGSADIWIAPSDGGAASRLTDWPSAEFNPHFSPDGKTIAFLSTRDSPGRDLWTMPAAGGAATRLTTIGVSGTFFRWSPDSKTIAFTARAEAGAGAAVFLVPASGGAPKQLSPAPSQYPEWRRDGRELKVMQCDKGYCSVDIWSADGKRLRTLTTGKDRYEVGTSWSSNGTQGLVTWQDILGDGGFRVDVRATAGGSSKTLANPNRLSMTAVDFADGDRSAVVRGLPNGTLLQRIEVSTLATVAKR